MLLRLDFSSEVPIYMQIRNGIVMGIARGELKPGEKLPAIRALAEECGVNMMTVNKAYQQLRQEGFIVTDRRSGARVAPGEEQDAETLALIAPRLRLLLGEARVRGLTLPAVLSLCEKIWKEEEV